MQRGVPERNNLFLIIIARCLEYPDTKDLLTASKPPTPSCPSNLSDRGSLARAVVHRCPAARVFLDNITESNAGDGQQ